jgi:hypothetical protein
MKPSGLLLHIRHRFTYAFLERTQAARDIIPPSFKNASGSTQIVAEARVGGGELRRQMLQLIARIRCSAFRRL